MKKTLLIGIQEGEERERTRSEFRMNNTIVNMYHNGIMLELIAKCTNKTIEEVENIINQATY